jgi:malonyl-CoA/methylmalonyl-CoA synthetase
MYSYLLSHYQQHMPPAQQAAARAAAAALRLTVSGSAAAPVSLLQQWRALSGQVLLERYGMTETGMILSNPYQVTDRGCRVCHSRGGCQLRPQVASCGRGSLVAMRCAHDAECACALLLLLLLLPG